MFWNFLFGLQLIITLISKYHTKCFSNSFKLIHTVGYPHLLPSLLLTGSVVFWESGLQSPLLTQSVSMGKSWKLSVSRYAHCNIRMVAFSPCVSLWLPFLIASCVLISHYHFCLVLFIGQQNQKEWKITSISGNRWNFPQIQIKNVTVYYVPRRCIIKHTCQLAQLVRLPPIFKKKEQLTQLCYPKKTCI